MLPTQRWLRADPAFVLGLIPAPIFLGGGWGGGRKKEVNLFGSECNFLKNMVLIQLLASEHETSCRMLPPVMLSEKDF